MQVGLIGLGGMGTAMARRLLEEGHQLTVWNRTRSKAEALQPDGARLADSPAAAAREAQVTFTMVTDDAAVEAVTLGPKGLAAGLAEDALHVASSTISVALSRLLAELHEGRGQRYLAAPLFGKPQAVASGQAVVIAAGAAGALQEARPLLEALGGELVVVGEEAHQAHVVKLAGNFLLAAAKEMLAEAFALVARYGLDPAPFAALTGQTLFGSPRLERYGRQIVAADYEPPGFKLVDGLKDVRLVTDAAADGGAPMPLASLLRDRYVKGVARGYGDLDWSAIGRLAAEDAGLSAEWHVPEA